MLDYLIIGAGISGITLARLLQKQGKKNILVIEKESEPGGLCRTKKINGHTLDIGGGHFLCTKYPEVYDFIFSHLPKSGFNYFDRVSKIELGESIIDFPIESNLWQLPLEQQTEYLISAIQSGEVLGKQEPKNYEQWIRWKLGDKVADNYMIPYNKKIWGVKPKEMDIDWLYKIPRLDTKEIVKSCLARKSDKQKIPSHAILYYPKTGGFQSIFDAIYEHVKDRVHLNEPLKKLEYKKGHWVINNKYKAKVVINTAPWIYIYRAMDKPKRLKNSMQLLKANTIVVSLWEKEYGHNWHWLYRPDPTLEQHREFFLNNFIPRNKKGGYFTETNIKRWPGKNGVWSWSNKKKPIYEYVCEFAYPIAIVGYLKAVNTVLDYFKTRNLHGLGRWGQWQYHNMDICMWHAMQLAKKI